MENRIKIKYDYVPKYYQTRMIQGHREEQCFVVHPEFYPKKPNQVERKENDRTKKNPIARRTAVEDSTKVGNMQQSYREEGFIEQRYKKWGGDRPKQSVMAWNRVGRITENKYNLLEQNKQEKKKEVEKGDLNFVDRNSLCSKEC